MVLFHEKSILSKYSSLPIFFTLIPVTIFYLKDRSYGMLYFLVSFTLVIISISLLLCFSTFTINVYPDRIAYRFSPFKAKKFKEIKLSEIKEIKFITIDPISDFGGIWGIRKSKKYGKGYLINGGGKGILIETKQEEKIFLTIKNIEKLKSILEVQQL